MSTMERNEIKRTKVKYERDPYCLGVRLNKMQAFLLFFNNPSVTVIKSQIWSSYYFREIIGST